MFFILSRRRSIKWRNLSCNLITAHFIPAALLFVAGYAGCQALGAAWLGIAALLVSGTAPAGALAAIADLAPVESPACAAAACALCSTLGAAGLLAANYFVTQALHGSASLIFCFNLCKKKYILKIYIPFKKKHQSSRF